MSEATVLDNPVVTQPNPSADAPPSDSDDSLGTLPAVEDQEPANQDGDSSDDAPPEYDPEALQARVDAGENLTTPEKEALRRHEQSEKDKTAARDEARRANQENSQKVTRQIQIHNRRVSEIVKAESDKAEAEARSVNYELLEMNLQRENATFMQAVAPGILFAYDALAKARIQEIHPDKAEAQRIIKELNSKPTDPEAAFNAALDAARAEGAATSDAAKKLKKAEDELAKVRGDLAKAKGDRAKGNSPSGDGRETSTGLPTKEGYGAMKQEERLQVQREHPDLVRSWTRAG